MGLGGEVRRDLGAGLELGFGVLVLEAVHLRAPRGVFGFHLGGDVGGRGGVRSLRLRGGCESEQWDGGFGEE